MKSNKVLTTGNVAEICNVSTRTVQKWIDDGILKSYRLPNSKDRRTCTQDLQKFITEYNLPAHDWLEDWLQSNSEKRNKDDKSTKTPCKKRKKHP